MSDPDSLLVEANLNRWTQLKFDITGTSSQLTLPAVELHSGHTYGDIWAASHYCGLRRPPLTPIRGEWDHGVMWPDQPAQKLALHSDGSQIREDEIRFFARLDQVKASSSVSKFSATAIGMPIVYAAATAVQRPKRIPGALLVMPPHSTRESRRHGIQPKYIKSIENISADFRHVVWCLHGSDILLGAHQRLVELGHTVVVGAYEFDINALKRMVILFSIFDVVTTPALGSHVAYAAWLGCRLSIFDSSKYQYDRGAAFDHAYYRRNPLVANAVDAFHSSVEESSSYSFLRTPPARAVHARAWGAEMVGADQALSPDELRRILGWSNFRLVTWSAKRVAKHLLSSLPDTHGRMILRLPRACVHAFGWRKGLRNFAELSRALVFSSGESVICLKSGRRLIMRNGTSDPLNVIQHFVHRELTSELPQQVTDFADIGAYAGYATAALLEEHPNCRVVCLEPDPENFAILSRNLGSLGNVTLIQAALWSDCQGVVLEPSEEGKWATRVGHGRSSTPPIESVTWESLLSEGRIIPGSVVKIDIEGAEVEVLSASWRSLLRSATMVFLEVHYWIPGVSKVVAEIFTKTDDSLELQTRQSGEFLVVRETCT